MDNIDKKTIKKINKSLINLPRNTQKELGVQSVQHNDNVFYTGNNVYKKIYEFKPSFLGKMKYEFIKELINLYNNRFRFSFYIINKSGKINVYTFLTVYFECADYFEAKQCIKDFETSFSRDIAPILNITVLECSLDTILTYVHLNCTGELKEIDTDLLFEKKGVDKIYTDIRLTDIPNIFECLNVQNRYGSIYVGNYISDDVANIINYFSLNDGTYQYSVEFQKYNNEEKDMYQREIKRKYCDESAQLNEEFINMSFIISTIDSDISSLSETNQALIEYFKKNGILLLPGIGREKDIFISCASIGLKEFHSMYNVNRNIVSELLL